MSNPGWAAALRLPKISAAVLEQDCALCGARSGGRLVCAACSDTLPWIARGCEGCAIPLASSGSRCGECMKRNRHAFDDAIAVFEYRFPIDRLVQRFKYAGDLALGRWLARSLAR